MSLSLYELNRKIAMFEFEIDEETGEILNDDELENLELEKEEKIENFALWIKNMRAEKEALKAEKEAFNSRIKRLERKINTVETIVAKELDGEKFKTPKVDIGWRRSTSVKVTDASALPDDLLRIKKEPDKTAIKKRIQSGETVEGASLIESTKMNIK